MSASRVQGSVVETLLAMRAGICRFNASRGLRTAIWFGSGWFLQWHEGPAAAVEEAWQLSLSYAGNGGHRLLHRSQGAAGLVGRLHLCTAHNRDAPDDVERRILRVEREQRLGWMPEPAQLWQQLSAPCLADAADSMGAVPQYNVVAVTAETTESVDLVRAIADRRHAQVTYQRLADCDLGNGDIGAAYVDVSDGAPMTRVHALSRRALHNAMVRLSLQKMQCMVLLLGESPGPAARLAGAVVKLLTDLNIRPAVRLIGASREVCLAAHQALSKLSAIDVADFPADASGDRRADAILKMIVSTRTVNTGLQARVA